MKKYIIVVACLLSYSHVSDSSAHDLNVEQQFARSLGKCSGPYATAYSLSIPTVHSMSEKLSVAAENFANNSGSGKDTSNYLQSLFDRWLVECRVVLKKNGSIRKVEVYKSNAPANLEKFASSLILDSAPFSTNRCPLELEYAVTFPKLTVHLVTWTRDEDQKNAPEYIKSLYDD